jgi:hypothetical protein
VAAPTVGQHTREVLTATLGYSDDQLALLAEAGAFGAAPARQAAAAEVQA